MDITWAELNERFSQLAQGIARLERKTDFILRNLNLEYIDNPGDSVPPQLAGVYALLQQGKRLQAIMEYRKLTNASLDDAKATLDQLEMGTLKG